MNMVALIPARAGSKRCPGKNTRLLGGHPLIAWTIAAARESGVFSAVLVSSEDIAPVDIAQQLGAGIIIRPPELAADDSPDIGWVRHVLDRVPCEAFALLRPTSPFRTAATIQRAFKQFSRSEVHSIRAVQLVKEHPGKMWQCVGAGYPMMPLIREAWPPALKGAATLMTAEDRPWHSQPTQSLPTVYVQNSSLEMAWSYVVASFGTISGTKIAPFFTEGHEGLAIDTEDDWDRAELLVAGGAVRFPAAPVAAAVSADPRD